MGYFIDRFRGDVPGRLRQACKRGKSWHPMFGSLIQPLCTGLQQREILVFLRTMALPDPIVGIILDYGPGSLTG